MLTILGIPAAAAHVPAAAGSSSPGEEVWRWWLPWMVVSVHPVVINEKATNMTFFFQLGHPVLLLCLRGGLRVLC
jgi:hypothetical protein